MVTHRQREAERQRDEYYNVAKVMDENNNLDNSLRSFHLYLLPKWKVELMLI